jgi:hypothetical protein
LPFKQYDILEKMPSSNSVSAFPHHEMASQLARYRILQQASTTMLAQANASKQNVLTLLQG